jgi:hypothetical protein
MEGLVRFLFAEESPQKAKLYKALETLSIKMSAYFQHTKEAVFVSKTKL